jgi:hypothetical protein
MEWPAPPSGAVGSPAVQEEEQKWILRSLASIFQDAVILARFGKVDLDSLGE